MWLWMLVATAAFGQDWHHPNTLIGVGAAPWGLTVRGEAWLATEVTGELGFGLRGFDVEQPVADWALRWRPRFACFHCGEQLLATLGLGVGGVVVPGLSGDPWLIGAGPDFAATGAYWVSRNTAFQITGRVGLGPVVPVNDIALDGIEAWYMLSGGLAF